MNFSCTNHFKELNTLMTENSRRLRPAFRTLLILAVAGATLTGCHKKDQGINPDSLGPTDTSSATVPAPTASITADPVAIDLGTDRCPQLAHAERHHRHDRRHRPGQTRTAPRPSALRIRPTFT